MNALMGEVVHSKFKQKQKQNGDEEGRTNRQTTPRQQDSMSAFPSYENPE